MYHSSRMYHQSSSMIATSEIPSLLHTTTGLSRDCDGPHPKPESLTLVVIGRWGNEALLANILLRHGGKVKFLLRRGCRNNQQPHQLEDDCRSTINPRWPLCLHRKLRKSDSDTRPHGLPVGDVSGHLARTIGLPLTRSARGRGTFAAA